MKDYYTRIFTTICLLCLLTTMNRAQTPQTSWPKFLGEGDSTVVAYTPRYGIKVFTGGFDLPRRKQVERKLPNKLLNAGVPFETISLAQDYARRLTGQDSPSTLLDDIDAAVDRVIGVWDSCGGSYSSFIRGFNWAGITITVRDSVFPTPDTGQLCYGVTTNKYNAQIVNLSFWYWFSDPPRSQLVTIHDIARWELGNVAYWNHHGSPKDIGDGRPCQ